MTRKDIRVFIYSDDGTNNSYFRPSVSKYEVLNIIIQNDFYKLIEGPFWDTCQDVPKCALKNTLDEKAYLLFWNIPSKRRDNLGRKILSSVIIEFNQDIEIAFALIQKAFKEQLLNENSQFIEWIDESFEKDKITNKFSFDNIKSFFKPTASLAKSIKLESSPEGNEKFLIKINNKEIISKQFLLLASDFIDTKLYDYCQSQNEICMFIAKKWVIKDEASCNEGLLENGLIYMYNLLESNVISDSSKIEYELIKARSGKGETFICINGFLCQKMLDEKLWIRPIINKHDDPNIFILKWESKKLEDIGEYFLNLSMKKIGIKILKRSIGGGWLLFIDIFQDFIKFPWFQALMATKHIAERLSKEEMFNGEESENITLLGHSLGARIIYNTLNKLNDKSKRIKEAYLFGAAVSSIDENNSWTKAYKSVKGEIYNFHSKKDYVLKFLYSLGTASIIQDAAGVVGVRNRYVSNKDVSHLINGHTEYKEKLPELI